MASTLPVSQVQPPVTQIVIDSKERQDLVVRSATIVQQMSQHEQVNLTCLMSETDISKYRDKTISFYWGPGGRGSVFNGYITLPKKEQDFQSRPQVSFQCQGVSRPLSTRGGPRFWNNTTTETIARDLLRNSGLGLVLDPVDYQWGASLAQTNESDWEMLNKVANTVGFVLTVQHGVVRMFDPKRLLSSTVPTIKLEKSTNLLSTNQSLLDFSAEMISPLSRETQVPRWAYFTTGAEVASINSTGTRFQPDYIRNYELAKLVEKRINFTADYWTQQATARARGTYLLSPGTLVDISTGQSTTIRDTNDGLWLITETQHQIDTERYQTGFKMMRDKARRATGSPQYTPFWTQNTGEAQAISPTCRWCMGVIVEVRMKSLAFPLNITRGGMSTTEVYAEIVRNQLIDAVVTNNYERVMRPNYGANLRQLLFDPTDELVRADVASAVQERLRIMVPRASILSVTLTLNDDTPNVVRFGVNYKVRFIEESLVVDIPLTDQGVT